VSAAPKKDTAPGPIPSLRAETAMDAARTHTGLSAKAAARHPRGYEATFLAAAMKRPGLPGQLLVLSESFSRS
jgi:hypothetical protein